MELGKLIENSDEIKIFADEARKIDTKKRDSLALNPDNAEQGLAQLVLTVVELLRRLMESQAMHLIDKGLVSDEEAERMGETFYKLEDKMNELIDIFHLKKEDLNLDLGPLGKLL